MQLKEGKSKREAEKEAFKIERHAIGKNDDFPNK